MYSTLNPGLNNKIRVIVVKYDNNESQTVSFFEKRNRKEETMLKITMHDIVDIIHLLMVFIFRKVKLAIAFL